MTQNNLFTTIFTKKWIKTRKLEYPLLNNIIYINEINNWLNFFNDKGWLTNEIKKNLLHSTSWSSFYGKINELRVGYFFEKHLKFKLYDFESITINGKNADFKGKINNREVFIEVKSPLKLTKNSNGSFDNSKKIINIISKANQQFHPNSINIVVLCDDLEVSLHDDLLAQATIISLFNRVEFNSISTICILGNIYNEDMYKMIFIQNANANERLRSENFQGFHEIRY